MRRFFFQFITIARIGGRRANARSAPGGGADNPLEYFTILLKTVREMNTFHTERLLSATEQKRSCPERRGFDF